MVIEENIPFIKIGMLLFVNSRLVETTVGEREVHHSSASGVSKRKGKWL